VNGTYEPLSRPIFIYVAEKAAQRPEVKAFVEYYLAQGKPLIEEVKYVPLPAQAYSLATEHFRSGKLGTGFGACPRSGSRSRNSSPAKPSSEPMQSAISPTSL
jgi:phosphate transport system substrate-binding protein